MCIYFDGTTLVVVLFVNENIFVNTEIVCLTTGTSSALRKNRLMSPSI